jgi:RHS repeat-associated protein
MVAINEIPLPGCAVEGCGGDTDVCTDGRVHRNAENRAPTIRNRCRGVALGRWLTRDPIGYRGGINLYGHVNSSPVGNVDAEGLATSGVWVPETDIGGTTYWMNTQTGAISYGYPSGPMAPVGGPQNAAGEASAGGLDIWIEGAWWGHERICVGDPTGSYTAFSFGLTSRWDIFNPFAKGVVYVATGRNGSREDMIRITAAQERDALYMLQQQVGEEMPYRLSYPNCRTFCSVNLELLKERYAHPPSPRGNCSGQPCTH